MYPASSFPPEGGQEWQGTYKFQRYPLAPKSPTVRFHTPSSSTIDCLMRGPYPGDTYWVSGTSGWRGRCDHTSLALLVPVPGCLLGSEPATCPRTQPAGRKFTPASTSETGSNSPAGPETPPLTLFVPVGPCMLPVSDHELCAFKACMDVTVRRACTAPATQEASGQEDEEAVADGAAAVAGTTHATSMDEFDELMGMDNDDPETITSRNSMIPSLSSAVACSARHGGSPTTRQRSRHSDTAFFEWFFPAPAAA